MELYGNARLHIEERHLYHKTVFLPVDPDFEDRNFLRWVIRG